MTCSHLIYAVYSPLPCGASNFLFLSDTRPLVAEAIGSARCAWLFPMWPITVQERCDEDSVFIINWQQTHASATRCLHYNRTKIPTHPCGCAAPPLTSVVPFPCAVCGICSPWAALCWLLSLATASGWSVSILLTHSGPGVTARCLWLHPSSCSFILL